MTVTAMGVARNYSRHRPRYPSRLFEDLRLRTIGDHGKRLVDWGCGTGELTLGLSPFFDSVTAVDLRPEMISVAKENARRVNAGNIVWRVGKAEDVEIQPESCDLITAASAFHWMDRELLARRACEGLKPGGAFALVGGGGGGGVRKGDAEWHGLAAECASRHIRLTPGSSRPRNPASEKPHADFLKAAGFQSETTEYAVDFEWRTEELIGYLYSIGFPPLPALGDSREEFERELREALLDANPSGIFHQKLDFYLTISRRP